MLNNPTSLPDQAPISDAGAALALDCYVVTPRGFEVPAWLVDAYKRCLPVTLQDARLRAFPHPHIVWTSAKREGLRWRLSELLRWEREFPCERPRRRRSTQVARRAPMLAHDWQPHAGVIVAVDKTTRDDPHAV